MRVLSVILILALTNAIMGDLTSEKGCSIVTLFGGTGKADAKTVTSPASCKSVKKTCCIDADFTKIKNNFNGPTGDNQKALDTILTTRLGYLDTVLTAFLSNIDSLKSRAKLVS